MISVISYSIEIFKYLYSEFSFSLLIMVIIIIFYKQIKNILDDLTKLHISWNDRSIGIEREKKETVELMQMLLKDKVGSEGKSVIYEGQRGAGGEELDTHDPMYFSNLITSKIFLINQVEKYNKFFIAEKLFEGYESKCMEKYGTNYHGAIIETRDENIILTDETIRKFYFLTKDIEKENEYLSLDDLNKFRLLIFAFTH